MFGAAHGAHGGGGLIQSLEIDRKKSIHTAPTARVDCFPVAFGDSILSPNMAMLDES